MRSLTSDGANLKLLSEGTGSGQVPARGDDDFQYATITIPHGYGSDELVWQVSIIADGIAYYSPFTSSAGSFYIRSFLDSTNLKIEVSDGAAVAAPAIPFTYYYRILIP